MDAKILDLWLTEVSRAYNNGGTDIIGVLRLKDGREFELATKTKGFVFKPTISTEGLVTFYERDMQVGQTEDATSWTTTYERKQRIVALDDIADVYVRSKFVEVSEKPLPPQPSESEE